MSRLSSCSLQQITRLRQRIEKSLKVCRCLQEAAQIHANALFEEFQESMVLVRVFGTTTFAALPEADRDFVVRLAASRNAAEELADGTVVVTLLGTRGIREAWNHRYKSREHLGIPLLRASFIKTIPMVARLMSEAVTGIPWIEKQKTHILVKSMGLMARLLYVDDAATAVSGEGFKIVPAQDFVASNHVRSIIGLGGGYLNRTFVATLCFTNERISQGEAEKFMPLINTFKTATMELAMQGRVFP